MKWLVVFAACWLVLSSSCVRRHQCTSHLRIRTIFNALEGDTSTYYYSNDGILVAISSSNGSRTTIQNGGSMVSGKTIDPRGKIISTWVCYLNNRGLVDSLVKRDSAQITLQRSYVYDEKGFAIEEHEYKPGEPCSVTHKNVSNGNITSYTVMQINPYPAKVSYNRATKKYDTVSITAVGKEYTVYTEYLPDHEKTTAFQNYGSPEFGEGVHNTEKRIVQVSPEGDTMDITVFKYAYDNYGRPSKCISRNLAGELLDSSFIAYY